jgi:tyrosyl-tRNA synthetase
MQRIFKLFPKQRKMSFSASIAQLDKIIDGLETPIEKPKREKPKKELVKEEDETITSFKKAHLQVSKIVHAEKHPNADSLVKCRVEVQPGVTKPLVAGILKSYQPSDLIDKYIITITNLKPVTLKGEQSEVMLFAATDLQSKVQKLLEPPQGSAIGDRVFLEGNDQGEALDRIPPKQWEKVVSGFLVNNGTPKYHGINLTTKNGVVTVGTCDGSEFH